MPALFAGAVLIGAVFVPTASAGLVEGAANKVGSTVKSVQDTVKSVPDTVKSVPDTANTTPPVPSTSPPPKPPKLPPAAVTPPPPPRNPVKSPAPPPRNPVKAPAPPSRDPVKSPSKESSPSPSRSHADPADLPAADGAAGTAKGVVGSVRNTAGEAATGAATPEHSDAGTATAAPSQRANRDVSEATLPSSRTATGPPVAVRAADVAVLQRWLARVWPAIALGGGEVSVLGALEVIAGDLFRPALAAVTGALLASSSILPTSDDPLPLDGRQGVAGASQSAPDDPSPVPAGGDGGGIVYLIAIAGLLGLLAFTVWREFRVALHPRLR